MMKYSAAAGSSCFPLSSTVCHSKPFASFDPRKPSIPSDQLRFGKLLALFFPFQLSDLSHPYNFYKQTYPIL